MPRPAGLQIDNPDQAYRGQDLVDPSTIRPRHTRRERLRRQEIDQKRQQGGKALTTSVASAETTERMWYSGGRVIKTRSQPWPKHLDGKSDHKTLIMCDQYVTEAARQEPAFGRPGQTLALLTPGYLTVVTPGDDTVLPAKQAIETSAALPYARGRQQEPIGERVIVNDLTGSHSTSLMWALSTQTWGLGLSLRKGSSTAQRQTLTLCPMMLHEVPVQARIP